MQIRASLMLVPLIAVAAAFACAGQLGSSSTASPPMVADPTPRPAPAVEVPEGWGVWRSSRLGVELLDPVGWGAGGPETAGDFSPVRAVEPDFGPIRLFARRGLIVTFSELSPHDGFLPETPDTGRGRPSWLPGGFTGQRRIESIEASWIGSDALTKVTYKLRADDRLIEIRTAGGVPDAELVERLADLDRIASSVRVFTPSTKPAAQRGGRFRYDGRFFSFWTPAGMTFVPPLEDHAVALPEVSVHEVIEVHRSTTPPVEQGWGDRRMPQHDLAMDPDRLDARIWLATPNLTKAASLAEWLEARRSQHERDFADFETDIRTFQSADGREGGRAYWWRTFDDGRNLWTGSYGGYIPIEGGRAAIVFTAMLVGKSERQIVEKIARLDEFWSGIEVHEDEIAAILPGE